MSKDPTESADKHDHDWIDIGSADELAKTPLQQIMLGSTRIRLKLRGRSLWCGKRCRNPPAARLGKGLSTEIT